MENLEICKLKNGDKPPYKLLLLADPSIKMVNKYIENGECYCGYVNKKIVGVYVVVATKTDTIEIMNIAVDEDYQGMGIGKKLIENITEYANINGIKIIEIGTGNSSLNQLALYQKCGFRIVDINKNFFVNNYEEKIFENGIQCVDMIKLAKNVT